MKYKEQEALVRDLRAMADFIEEKGLELPTLRVSVERYVGDYHMVADKYVLDEFSTRLKMRKYAKALGKAEKQYTNASFTLRREFGNLAIEIRASREGVCRKVETGETRTIPAVPATEERIEPVYEWVCDDPLLKG